MFDAADSQSLRNDVNGRQPFEQQAAIVARVVIVAWRSCSCCSLGLMKLVARADDKQVLSVVVTTDNRAYKKTCNDI
jgi:hypothetical protein